MIQPVSPSVLLYTHTCKSLLQLAKAGRCVVAAARDSEKARSIAEEAAGGAEFEGGVDVTSPDSLSKHIFQGVSQVVLAVGPTFSNSEAG